MRAARIAAAKTSVDAQAYSFTSSAIAKAVVNAHNRGVKVRVIRLHETVAPLRQAVAPFRGTASFPRLTNFYRTLRENCTRCYFVHCFDKC